MAIGIDQWAFEEFGAAALGDSRRGARARALASGLARRPHGRVSEVFGRAADREGAYDFLENKHFNATALAEGMFAATARRAHAGSIVYVAVDGSTLSLLDRAGTKDFGPVGTALARNGARGLMTMNALAVDSTGVPLGLADQALWSRSECEKLSNRERTKRDQHRAFESKESAFFLACARRATERLAAVGANAWVVIDRGGDSRDILLGLHRLGCLFTVRASWDREIFGADPKRLRAALDASPSLGDHEVELPRTAKREARTAIIEVCATQVVLRFRKRPLQPAGGLRLWAVRLRERVTDPSQEPVEWVLYTNVPVLSNEHAKRILASYRARWRVEEFHRTWKNGGCCSEDTQLRSVQAVMKWATMHAAVATRIERLKYLARKEPNRPASEEFSAAELEALRLDQLDRGTRNVPEAPTLEMATKWLAEFGGWIRRRDNFPGSTVLTRGLERLGWLVEGIALGRKRDAPKT